jgi:hypothetical protein
MKERKKAANTTATTTLAPIIILVPSAADEETCMTAVATLFAAPAAHLLKSLVNKARLLCFVVGFVLAVFFLDLAFQLKKIRLMYVYKQLVGLPGFAWVFYCQLYLSFALFLCLSISLYLCLIPLSLPNLT